MALRHLFRVSQVVAAALLLSCTTSTPTGVANRQYAAGTGPSDKLQLPAPFATPSARNNSKVIGWPKGKMPTAAPGFEVSLFAENLDNPRQAYVRQTVTSWWSKRLVNGPDGLTGRKNLGIKSPCSETPIMTGSRM